MGDVVDVTFDDFDRCCNGCQIMKDGENTLHKIGETTNPNKMWNRIFCESTRIWGQTTLVFGTVEIEISLRFDKKYFSIIQGFQLQRPMISYLQVDANLLTFWTISYFHFLYL